MALSAKAIEQYLDKPVPYMPEFKHADIEVLNRSIYNCTGQFFKSKTPPRGNYQIEGLAFALYLRRALLFFDMRIGKTWIGLNWAEHLRRANLWRNSKGLVVAHSPLGLGVWETEAAKHCNLNVRVIHLDTEEFCDALEDKQCDLIVVPWSGMQSLFSMKGTSKEGKPTLYPDLNIIGLAASMFGLCMFDEIHMCMHPGSLRFKIAAGVTANSQFRLGLTGTPIGRDPYGLWAQSFLIDRGDLLSSNYYFFEKAFGGRPFKAPWSGRWTYKFSKHKLPKLLHKMNTIAMTYKRSEITEEEVLSGIVDLHLAGDQREAYYGLIERIIKLASEQTIEILNSFHRLRQISSGYLPFNDDEDTRHVVHFKNNPKLEWLSEVVEADPEVQVVIFHDYTHTGELICNVLKKHKRTYGWLYGGVSTLEKSNAIVADFQKGRTQYLVANPRKGGMGIDLPQCDYMVFFESPVPPIVRQQAEARPMSRVDRPLVIDDLVISPVERRILEWQGEGKDMMRSLASARRGFAK